MLSGEAVMRAKVKLLARINEDRETRGEPAWDLPILNDVLEENDENDQDGLIVELYSLIE